MAKEQKKTTYAGQPYILGFVVKKTGATILSLYFLDSSLLLNAVTMNPIMIDELATTHLEPLHEHSLVWGGYTQ
jgi:hypothetical protein